TSGGTDTIRTTASVILSGLTVNGAADFMGSTSLGIEQILIQSGTTATFSGTQLDLNAIVINETGVGNTGLTINVAANQTNSFANLNFTGTFTGGNVFDTSPVGDVDTIIINGDNVGSESITGTSFADSINGMGGDDTLVGGAG